MDYVEGQGLPFTGGVTEYELEAIRQAFPDGEFEDFMTAGLGIAPQMSECEQPVSPLTALLVIGMVFLCVVLTVAGT